LYIIASGSAVDENLLLLLAVTDSGKGIYPEILPRILERFFTTKKPKWQQVGTGYYKKNCGKTFG
jgi:signal transduction histidine kinase